jgi:hypothetical protein
VIIVVNKIDQLQGQGAAAAVSGPPGRRRRVRGDRSGQRGAASSSPSCSPKRASICRTTNCCSPRTRLPTAASASSPPSTFAKSSFRLIGDELPYAAAVEVEKFSSMAELRRISAAILVDREGHKSIVIGRAAT